MKDSDANSMHDIGICKQKYKALILKFSWGHCPQIPFLLHVIATGDIKLLATRADKWTLLRL